MACDCNKEIYKIKEVLRREMRDGFNDNANCHSDLKEKIAKVVIRIVKIESFLQNKKDNEKYMKTMLWSILGSVLTMVVIGILTLVFKAQ